MKRQVVLATSLAAMLSAMAAVTVTAPNGLDAIEIGLDAASTKTEIWCVWDETDKGDSFANWSNSARVAVVEPSQTSVTCALPSEARTSPWARFFLFTGGATYPVTSIRSSEGAYINTGFNPTPNTAVGADFQYVDTATTQQRVFGAHGTLQVSCYMNGNGYFAWAFKNGTGNWADAIRTVTPHRTQVLLDPVADVVRFTQNGEDFYSKKMSDSVAAKDRTNTSAVPLYLMAASTSSGAATYVAQMHYFGATIDDAGVRVHTYVPYVKDGTAGLLDTVTETFLSNANTTSGVFTPYGRADEAAVLDASAAFDVAAANGGALDVQDLIVNVDRNKEVVFDGPSTINQRLVKIGAGTLVLEGTRTFTADVVVSNGYLRGTYNTCGLAGTHLVLASPDSNHQAQFQEVSDTFTAPLGDSGAGTVELRGYSGIVPYNQDLTLNFGGDGRTLTRYQSGFRNTSLVMTGNARNVHFMNSIDLGQGQNFEVKSGGSGTAFHHGSLTNQASGAGTLKFWGGKQVIVGTIGTANERAVDVYCWRVEPHAGTVVFSNATLRTVSDLRVSLDKSNTATCTFVNSTRIPTSGWDYVYGKSGSTLTIDGGEYNAGGKMTVGSSTDAELIGLMIITNDAAYTQNKGALEINKTGTLRLYSGSYTLPGLLTHNSGLIEQFGGTLNLKSSNSAVGYKAGESAAFGMTGGSLYAADGVNFQIGGYGKGWFHQTGGTVSAPNYFAVGRFTNGVGRLDVHGGTFTHRNSNRIRIGEDGTGTVSVANGGEFIDLATYSPLSVNAKGKGTLVLSPDGTFTTPQLRAGAAGRDSGVVFNGGTLKLADNTQKTAFLDSTIARVTVSPYGGAIDTNGKGDFTLNRALGPTTDAEDLSEALVHRWRFDSEANGLVDEIGGLTAKVNGKVAWTNGAVRLQGTGWNTSNLDLGLFSDLVPTNGSGATVEVWVTPMKYVSWARVLDFGSSADGKTGSSDKDFHITFNDGKDGSTARSCFSMRVGGGLNVYTDKALLHGRTYHVAMTFEPLVDGRLHISAYIHDATTGDLIAKGELFDAEGRSLADLAVGNHCYLGRSGYNGNYDADALYHELRIHNRTMTEAQAQASTQAGPDAAFYFAKKGAGTLTLTGANTYVVGTAVEGGTLKLASGASLPVTEAKVAKDATLDLSANTQTVKELTGAGTVANGTLAVAGNILPGGAETIGTLTLSGATLTSGNLVVDLDAETGASDAIVSTGDLDLSNLTLEISDLAALEKSQTYTLATATSVTGHFKATNLVGNWRVGVTPTQVTLSRAGMVFYIR